MTLNSISKQASNCIYFKSHISEKIKKDCPFKQDTIQNTHMFFFPIVEMLKYLTLEKEKN